MEVAAWPVGKDGQRPNLNPEFVADFEKRLGLFFVSDGKGDLKKTFGPEDVFNYIYAVFHSPTYRSRYAEFLKSDFPRAPLTSDVNLFRSLCGLGAELVALHLLESPKLENPLRAIPSKARTSWTKASQSMSLPASRSPALASRSKRAEFTSIRVSRERRLKASILKASSQKFGISISAAIRLREVAQGPPRQKTGL